MFESCGASGVAAAKYFMLCASIGAADSATGDELDTDVDDAKRNRRRRTKSILILAVAGSRQPRSALPRRESANARCSTKAECMIDCGCVTVELKNSMSKSSIHHHP